METDAWALAGDHASVLSSTPFDSSTSTYFSFTHTHLKNIHAVALMKPSLHAIKLHSPPFPEGDSTETRVAPAPRSRFLVMCSLLGQGLMGAPLAQQSVVPKKPKGTQRKNRGIETECPFGKGSGTAVSGPALTGQEGKSSWPGGSGALANLAALLCSLESSPLSCISLAPAG